MRHEWDDGTPDGAHVPQPPGTLNVWPGRIRRRVFQGDFTEYRVEWDGRELVVRAAGGDAMSDGDDVFVSVAPRYCVLLEE